MIKWDLPLKWMGDSTNRNQWIWYTTWVEYKIKISSTDAEKAFEKNLTSFMIKAVNNLSIEGIYLNIVKKAYDKLIDKIMLDSKTKTKTKSFPCKIKKKRKDAPSYTPISIILNPFQSNLANKRHANQKGRGNISCFQMALYFM